MKHYKYTKNLSDIGKGGGGGRDRTLEDEVYV